MDYVKIRNRGTDGDGGGGGKLLLAHKLKLVSPNAFEKDITSFDIFINDVVHLSIKINKDV